MITTLRAKIFHFLYRPEARGPVRPATSSVNFTHGLCVLGPDSAFTKPKEISPHPLRRIVCRSRAIRRSERFVRETRHARPGFSCLQDLRIGAPASGDRKRDIDNYGATHPGPRKAIVVLAVRPALGKQQGSEQDLRPVFNKVSVLSPLAVSTGTTQLEGRWDIGGERQALQLSSALRILESISEIKEKRRRSLYNAAVKLSGFVFPACSKSFYVAAAPTMSLL